MIRVPFLSQPECIRALDATTLEGLRAFMSGGLWARGAVEALVVGNATMMVLLCWAWVMDGLGG